METESSRIVLVTGGTRGIGRAVAATLLSRGNRLAFTGTSLDGVSRAERELGDACGDPGRVLGLTCDVRDPASVEAAVRTASERFGGLQVLVNNAGVGVGAPVADLALEEWDRIIGVNLTGTFHCSRAVIPHLRAAGGGWIINVSSLSSTHPFAGGAAYTAAKAGVNAFSEALMQELRPDGIRVAVVLPGSVSTEFNNRPAGNGADWKLHPEDVAQVIADLLDHPARSLPSRVEIRPARTK
ncbi:MAG: SDR family oxidoreductase [Vicinamibacterales bacterium]